MPPRRQAKALNQLDSQTGSSRNKGKGKQIDVDKGKRKEKQIGVDAVATRKTLSPRKHLSPTAIISNLAGGLIYTFNIHHSGHFSKKPEREYVGGLSLAYPRFGLENLTISELENMVQKLRLGCENTPVYYRVPGMDLNLGLKILSDENDISEIVSNIEILGCSEIDLYLDETASFYDSNIAELNDHVSASEAQPNPAVDNEYAEVNGNNDVGNVNNDVGNDNNAEVNFDEAVELMCQSVEATLSNDANKIEYSDEYGHDSDEDSDFVDSDYGHDSDDDDDDALFDDCVDKTAEWVGVSSLGAVADGSNPHVTDLDATDNDICDLDSDLHSVHSSDDENIRAPEFNERADMSNVEFAVGMLFATKDILKGAILEYGLQKSKAVNVYKNDKIRIRARCSKGQCPWSLYAANIKDEETFQVRTYRNEHNCGRVFKNKVVRAPWLAKKYLNEFRADPQWSIKAFRARLQSDYVVGCSKSQLYRARSMAIHLVSGSELEQYSKVYDYCEELRRSNPGTTAIVQTNASLLENGRPTFKRLYICLAATKKGFLAGCRKVIGVDGCHLKGSSTGQILAAVSIDGNNQSFPVAFAVVEAENRDSWEWFLGLLKDDLEITRDNEGMFTFINDKQKGLIPALEALVGGAEHRHCAWHLYTNFKELHKGKHLKDKMDQASKATTVPEFHRAMTQLRALDEAAYQWLATKDEPRYWSRSHFKTLTKCDMLTNNPCESFNSFIGEARDKPILSLCETIRNLLMDRLSTRKHKMLKHQNKLCPEIVKKLETLKLESCGWSPLWAGDLLYQVSCSDHEQYAVDLEKRTCSCKKWDLNGIPCAHAISAIYHQNFIPEDFVDECYFTSTNLKIYEHVIFPMNGQSMWAETPYNRPLPPPYKKQPGRPKKLRKRGVTEVALPKTGKMTRHGMPMKCKICGNHGHNLRSCLKRQKTDTTGASQRSEGAQSVSGTQNNIETPVQMSQSVSNAESNFQVQSQPAVRRSPRKKSSQFSNTGQQMSQTTSAPLMPVNRRPEKMQPRRSATASAQASGNASACASASASASGAAFASATASANTSGTAKAKASTKFTSSQAAKYKKLVNQGRFSQI